MPKRTTFRSGNENGIETRGHKMLAGLIARGETLSSIGRACGVGHSAVFKWRNSATRPRAQHRRILAVAFGIPEDAWLLPKERSVLRRLSGSIAQALVGT